MLKDSLISDYIPVDYWMWDDKPKPKKGDQSGQRLEAKTEEDSEKPPIANADADGKAAEGGETPEDDTSESEEYYDSEEMLYFVLV